jgi:hypothetical protein
LINAVRRYFFGDAVVGFGEFAHFDVKKSPTPPTALHIAINKATPTNDPYGIPRINGITAAIEHDDKKLENPCVAGGKG